jgi:hypothetical protein
VRFSLLQSPLGLEHHSISFLSLKRILDRAIVLENPKSSTAFMAIPRSTDWDHHLRNDFQLAVLVPSHEFYDYRFVFLGRCNGRLYLPAAAFAFCPSSILVPFVHGPLNRIEPFLNVLDLHRLSRRYRGRSLRPKRGRMPAPVCCP